VFASDSRNQVRRMAVLSDLIEKADATFVALQEVDDWFFAALQQQTWIKKYYQSDVGSGHAPGGLLILSKYPLNRVAFFEATAPNQPTSDQRSHVLIANAQIDSRQLTLATVALDWRAAQNRVDTLDYVFAVLSQFPDVLLLGDFNFDDQAEPESAHVSGDYVDLWPALRPHQAGFTWDPISNPYARFSDSKSNPSRIDRVLVKSSQWLARSINLVGCGTDTLCERHASNADAMTTALLQQDSETRVHDEDAYMHYPSNHFGILVNLSRFKPHC